MKPTCAVLLIPGLRSTAQELAPLSGALVKQGLHVVNLHITGYGFDRQLQEQSASAYTGWIDYVSEQALALRQEYAAVVIAGQSAGAVLALAAGQTLGRKIEGLVLLSTVLHRDGWAMPWYRFLLPLALYTPLGRFWKYRERAPYGVKNPRVRTWIERELSSRQVSAAGAATIGNDFLREFDQLRKQVLRCLGQQELPKILALHAREDEVAGLSNIEELRKKIPEKQLKIEILSNSCHLIAIDHDREYVYEKISYFCKCRM